METEYSHPRSWRPKNKTPNFKSLEVIGDYWNLLIINSLIYGGKTFTGLQRNLNGINPKTLTSRLKNLQQSNILKKEDRIYSLTSKGRRIVPILAMIERYFILD